MNLVRPGKIRKKHYGMMSHPDPEKDQEFKIMSLAETILPIDFEPEDDYEADDEEYEDMELETEMELEAESEIASEV